MRTEYMCRLAVGQYIILPRASGQGPTWGMSGYVTAVEQPLPYWTRITLDNGAVFCAEYMVAWCVVVDDKTATTQNPSNGLPAWVRELLP